MGALTVWVLLVAGSGHGGPAVVGRFPDQRECLATAAQIEKLSAEKRNMTFVYGICVKATVLKEGGDA